MHSLSLIICTYQRPYSLLRLLESVKAQKLYPDQIIVVDGSIDKKTENAIAGIQLDYLDYYLVSTEHRGLTRQRNFGISKVMENIEVICFLDDDVVLLPDYFEKLIMTYGNFPDALGVGGFIIEKNVKWQRLGKNKAEFNEFEFDGWKRELGSRNVLRKKLNLLSDRHPGIMPEFSHGFSIGFLPPSGKTYPVEYFMGCAMSFKASVTKRLKFSDYFEGYGLYEDLDFCLKVAKLGPLYVNTAAKLYHHHASSGRPNQFKYGKMVSRNGKYVWRLKYPNPKFKAKIKFYKISLLLTLVRFGNIFNTSTRKEAFTEALGRFYGILINTK